METGRLHHLLVLHWHRDASGPTRLPRVDLRERRDLLAATMKSPGPFHLLARDLAVDEEAYLHHLEHVQAWEVRGRVDFEAATAACLQLLEHGDA